MNNGTHTDGEKQLTARANYIGELQASIVYLNGKVADMLAELELARAENKTLHEALRDCKEQAAFMAKLRRSK